MCMSGYMSRTVMKSIRMQTFQIVAIYDCEIYFFSAIHVRVIVLPWTLDI